MKDGEVALKIVVELMRELYKENSKLIENVMDTLSKEGGFDGTSVAEKAYKEVFEVVQGR